MYQSSLLLGVSLTWLMAQLLEEQIATSICAVFCAIHACLLFFLPESPVYLYEESAIKAEKALAWYRGCNDIYTEMRDIKQYSEMRKLDPTGTDTMIYSKVVVKAILIVMGIKFFSISSGYHIFLCYNVDMITELIDIVDTVHDTVFYGILMYISNFISLIIHYKTTFPIRIPLILSSILVTVVLTVFTVYLYLVDTVYDDIDDRVKHAIPVICVSLLIPAYETGLSCYAEIALIAYVPHEVYPKAKNIIKIWHWLLVFIYVKHVIIIRDATPYGYVPILILAVLSFFGIFYIMFFVIETKGKSLVEVQRSIGGNPIGSRGRLRHIRLLTTAAPS